MKSQVSNKQILLFLLNPIQRIRTWRKEVEPHNPGSSPGPKIQILGREEAAKERAVQRVRSLTVQNEMRDVLGRMTVGAT